MWGDFSSWKTENGLGNSQRKKCISTAVKENFCDKISKLRMFMLSSVFQNKGYFYVPLCRGNVEAVMCGTMFHKRSTLKIKGKENILKMRVSDNKMHLISFLT